MARKKPHEEHENHERWLVSYADFITLLFAFFVVMYAISSVNEGKYRVLSDALVAAFRSSPKSLQPIQVGSLSKAPVTSEAQEDERKPAMVRLPKMFVSQSESLEGEVRDPLMEEKYLDGDDVVNIAKIADAVQEALQELVDEGLITINRDALWIEVEIKDSVLFPSGSARLQDEAIPILQELARILRQFPNPLRIEGHTDNIPIHTVVYPSNWELSAARAASVIRLFVQAGIDPTRMVAQGYGEFRPVADNDTPEGRARNRRVTIVVLANKTVERLLGDRVRQVQRRLLKPVAETAIAAGEPAPAADASDDKSEDIPTDRDAAVPAAGTIAGTPSVGTEAQSDDGEVAVAGAETPQVQPVPASQHLQEKARVDTAEAELPARRSLQPVRWREDAAAERVPMPEPPPRPWFAPLALSPPLVAPSLGASGLGAPSLTPQAVPSGSGLAGSPAEKVQPQGNTPPAPLVVQGETLSEITGFR